MSSSGLKTAGLSTSNRRIVVLVGAPLASALPTLPALRDHAAVLSNAKSEETGLVEQTGHSTGEVDESCLTTCELANSTSRLVSVRPLPTRQISYISSIPTSEHLRAFGPQYFSFLAVIMSMSQPIRTKSGQFTWITIVDSSVSYQSLILDTQTAVQPLPISVWDIDKICYRKGSRGQQWMPNVGDVIYVSDVLTQEYRGTVSGTTRRHITKMRLLSTPKDMREMNTMGANRDDLDMSPFSRTMREFVLDLKNWVDVIESNKSMISTPEVVK
ncbi:hypothetical protein V1525DRAFT_392824 [Lipomyces kononenkoae]|uniref:Uncharacterized protein n=1 Tax=Lipomyces kononenkoae TaxID=34357 RepID=A0ACC3TCF1_LIPKO